MVNQQPTKSMQPGLTVPLRGTLFAWSYDRGAGGVDKVSSKFPVENRKQDGACATTAKSRRERGKAKRRVSAATIAQRYLDLLRLREKISEVESWRPR
jgi:hypothetical protein